MKCELLSPGELAEWAACIPQELFVELVNRRGGHYALGILFLGEAQGALIWADNDQGVLLESLYVRPQARRLGLGKALVQRFLREVRQGGRRITVSYVEQGERRLLTPFLQDSGFMIDRVDFPAGAVRLRRLTEDLLPQLGTDRSGIRPLYQLSARERSVCEEWLQEQLGQPLKPYLVTEPASFAAMKNGEVWGAVLLRRQGEEMNLDYCWIRQSNPMVLAKLLACAIEHLDALYAPETVVRMTLSTAQAQTLFGRLFGQTEEKTSFCNAAYDNGGE